MEHFGQAMLLAPSSAAKHLLFIKDYAGTAPSPPYAPPPPPSQSTDHGIVPAQRVALFAGASLLKAFTTAQGGSTHLARVVASMFIGVQAAQGPCDFVYSSLPRRCSFLSVSARWSINV